ncbi:MAG: ATP synthase F0 subunit C [bacterium]|jgi:F-type H+-transporting ATPase subunit c
MDLYFLGLGIAALGSGIGIGIAVNGALQAMGRQPSIQGQLQTSMIIGAAFIEALTIYALVATYLRGGG